MKTILSLFLVLSIVGCTSPQTAVDGGGGAPVYSPPLIDGAKEINVLRPANGTVLARGLIAEEDPLFAACNEPGTVYIFYSDNALVQYVPEDGTYTIFSLACKGDVERHNAVNPDDLWDIVTVSAPGPVFDMSHDPAPILLRIRFLNNDGTDHLFSGQEVNMVAADSVEYATWVFPDGSPRPITKQTFDLWGATDGQSVIHMQLGGDGLDIPAATFHY